jgi:hypothetical protein
MQKASPSWQEAKDWQWQEACRRETVIRPREIARSRAPGKKIGLGTIQTLSAASTDPCRPRGEGSSWSGSKAGPNGCASRRSLRRRAFKRQSERCSKAATTLDLSENPGEKTLMHLLRDLTANDTSPSKRPTVKFCDLFVEDQRVDSPGVPSPFAGPHSR